MNKQLIGLVGFEGSGKDTVGQLLKTNHQFETNSFANSLKQSLAILFDWDPVMLQGLTVESRMWREQPDLYWSQALGRTVTPRSMMREYGTEIIRNSLNFKFWTLRLKKEIINTPGNVVVTDVRFLNEIEMIKSLGGKIVWIRRDPLPAYYSQALWYNSRLTLVKYVSKPFLPNLRKVHQSERDWIGTDFDYTISNNGSLADLEKSVNQMICMP